MTSHHLLPRRAASTPRRQDTKAHATFIGSREVMYGGTKMLPSKKALTIPSFADRVIRRRTVPIGLRRMPTRSSWTISLIYSPLRNPSNGMFLRCSEQKVERKLTDITLRGDANRRLHARTLSRSARDFIPTVAKRYPPERRLWTASEAEVPVHLR